MIKTNQILSIGSNLSIKKNLSIILSKSAAITALKLYVIWAIQSGNWSRPSVSFTFHAKKIKKPLRTRLSEIKHLLHQKILLIKNQLRPRAFSLLRKLTNIGIQLKKTRNMFNPLKSVASWVYITFHQITQKLLTTYTFCWLELWL